MLLMRQGEQAWLLTSKGNNEFARVFWVDDDGKGARYRVGQGGAARVGTSTLLSLDIDARGASLAWSCGRKSLIPLDWFQYTFVTL